jgi:hypothetical protein
MFSTEDDLVTAFLALVESRRTPWGQAAIVREFPYISGRTDVVLATEQKTVAIEAKLKDWRRALNQAYRIRSA